MLLGNLRIRGKLAALVAIPLVAVVALTIPVVTDRIGLASQAADTAQRVDLAGRFGSLIQSLQSERLVSAGYLLYVVDRSDLLLETADVTDRVISLRADLGDQLTPELSSALDGIRNLGGLRASIQARATNVDQVYLGFGAVANGLIDALELVSGTDATTVEGRQIVALDALLRADEANSVGAALLAQIATEPWNQKAILRYSANRATVKAQVERFTAFATEDQVRLFELVTTAYAARSGIDPTAPPETDPLDGVRGRTTEIIFPSLQSLIILGRFIETKIVTDVSGSVLAEERSQRLAVGLTIGVSTAVLIIVGLLTAAVARVVARPLSRLTHSADLVARAAEQELVRVADEESDQFEPVHLDPIDVHARDEIGDLARAFERVQGTAAGLVERQALSRRNVAQMFGHIGRRTQNLVGRQLSVIDRLEQQETNPDRLKELYRLDHVASRLRRNAASLVVLSGTAVVDEHLSPLSLADAVRLSLGEIEDYTRVDVDIDPAIVLAPAVISDGVLIIAELMENATTFSPPTTRVTVTATLTPDGAELSVIDHGIGLTSERLAEENARLERRERLDLAPTEVLGLFVVGRLARRHNLGVGLTSTPGGGLTATVVFRPHVLYLSWQTLDQNPAGAMDAIPANLVSVSAGRNGRSEILEGEASELVGSGSGRSGRGAPLALVGPPAQTYTGQARVPGTQPAPDSGEAGFNPNALERVNRLLETGHSWNAFAPTKQLPGSGAEPTTPDSPWTSQAPTRSALPARPPAPPGPAAPAIPTASPTPAAPPRPAAPTLPVVTPRRPMAQPGPEQQRDAAAARVAIENIEAGIRRAQSQNVGQDPPLSTVVRRVPGATLASMDRPNPPSKRKAEDPVLDPAQARDLIEQFESGVARALGDARQGTSHEGHDRP